MAKREWSQCVVSIILWLYEQPARGNIGNEKGNKENLAK